MNINLNKISPDVLINFNQVESDEGVWLIRFEKEKEVEAIVNISRTSANYYLVIGVYRGKSKSQRFCNVEEISNYLKQNFCKTLLE